MKLIAILLLSSISYTIATAQDVSREEFEALQARVQALEKALIETQGVDLDAITREVQAQTEASKDGGDKTVIIENVITAIQSREESATYPWMDASKWAKIEKGATIETVLDILGDPYTIEPSLRKRIDKVFTYTGRRIATNKKVTGIVRFYKDRVVNIEMPEL